MDRSCLGPDSVHRLSFFRTRRTGLRTRAELVAPGRAGGDQPATPQLSRRRPGARSPIVLRASGVEPRAHTPTAGSIQALEGDASELRLRCERVFRAGYDPRRHRPGDQPFDPDFLELLRPFAVLRFHQFRRVSFSATRLWSDRAPPDAPSRSAAASWARSHRACPWEWELRLCNAVHAECWLSVPATASPAYARALARLVRQELDDDLRV